MDTTRVGNKIRSYQRKEFELKRAEIILCIYFFYFLGVSFDIQTLESTNERDPI